MSEQGELRACPFCGREVRWCKDCDSGECALIVCEKCNLEFSQYDAEETSDLLTRAQRTEAWNRRADLGVLKRARDALAALHGWCSGIDQCDRLGGCLDCEHSKAAEQAIKELDKLIGAGE